MEEKEEKLLIIEKLFTDYIHQNNPAKYSTYINFCCNEEDEKSIILMGNIIEQLPKYSKLGLHDIYLVLVFIYYALRLTEDYDTLTQQFIVNNAINKSLAIDLYMDITTQDIMFNGSNISSEFRRHILGVMGGKRRNKKRKTNRKKRRNSRRRKSKRRK